MATNSINIGSNIIGSVTITGIPSAGNVIIATDANDGYWGPLSSSGGSITLAGAVTGPSNANLISLTGNSSITGALPSVNQAPQTLGGDLSGTTAASVLSAIDGYAVPNPGNHTGVFQSSGSALTFGTVSLSSQVAGTLPLANLAAGTTTQVLLVNGTTNTWTTLSGDVTVGATGTTTVNSISGASPLPITPSSLSWVKGATSPTITQTAPTSDIATQNLIISPQPAYASAVTNLVCGNVIINFAGNVTGYNANANSLTLQTNGTTFMQITPNGGVGGAYLLAGSSLNIQNSGATVIRSTGSSITYEGSAHSFQSSGGTNGFVYTPAAASTIVWSNGVATSITETHTAPASVSSGNGTAGATRSLTVNAGGAVTTATGSVTGGAGGSYTVTAGVGGAASGAATTNAGGAGGSVTVKAGAGGAATSASTNDGGNGGNLVLASGTGGTGSTAAGANGNVQLQVGPTVVEQYLPVSGTTNSQTNRVDTVFGNCETVSTATATQVATYTTASATGGIINMSIVSRATTIGTGIAVGDTGAANYTLTFRNVAGTVALSTAGITLVGTAQTTNATFTAPVLTTTISGAVITVKVVNVALCTVDSQVILNVVVC